MKNFWHRLTNRDRLCIKEEGVKRILLSILISIGVFGVIYLGKELGLEVGDSISTRLTPPNEPISGSILTVISLLPYIMGAFAGILFFVFSRTKGKSE